LKERAGIQFLTPKPPRPLPPLGLNLTTPVKNEEDLTFESDQMTFGGIRETVRDERRELKKQWDLELERWEEKSREWESKAYRAIANEKTVFESFLEMGKPEHRIGDGE